MELIFEKNGLKFYIDDDSKEIIVKENNVKIISFYGYESMNEGFIDYGFPEKVAKVDKVAKTFTGGLYEHKKVVNRYCFAVNKMNAKNKLGAMKSNVRCIVSPEVVRAKKLNTIEELKNY